MKNLAILILIFFTLTACTKGKSQTAKTAEAVERQQSQYSTAQPVPAFDWSLERDLVIQLYNIRNLKALTHSVWRSDRGLIEGDCPSIGFGIPYDTSLTNPLVATSKAPDRRFISESLTSVEQAEPNGIFASKNTSATWIMCAGDTGQIEPIYVETKVTVYPYPVKVDYENNRAIKSGKAVVTIRR